MGMFDTAIVTCPHCGKITIEFLEYLVKNSVTVIGDKTYDEFISKDSIRELIAQLKGEGT